MLVNFSYQELMQISAALAIIDTVYGDNAVLPLMNKVNDVMNYMDNAPITDVYPGVGTVIT